MYIDEIKLFSKNDKEIETLIQAVKIYSQDIQMEFGIKKCPMLIMSSGKTTNDGKKIKKNQNTSKKGNLQVLGNTGSGHHQTSGDERKKITQN